MRALIVYESMFGNTRHMAEAIAEGLQAAMPTTVLPVAAADFDALNGADLLLVGGPTHVHGMSRPATREEATRWASNPESDLTLEPMDPALGVREWMETAEHLPALFAAFDTRADAFKWLTGSAAGQIAKVLRRRGSKQVVPPGTFLAPDNDADGSEIDRAREWGRALGEAALAARGVTASAG
ncbi:MAG: flavodoxin family protein [Rhodoglobus sp.]